jgi:anti-anti-sigma regulatory factor
MAPIATRLRLTADDKAAMATYWAFYEPIAEDVDRELRASLAALPEWAPMIRAMTEEQAVAQSRASIARQRKALVDGDWAPYLEDVRAQGVQYARAGVSFVAWYDIIAIYREAIRRRLVELVKQDPMRAAVVAEGLNRMIDIAMSHLGEAYLATKEQIITQQQEAIRDHRAKGVVIDVTGVPVVDTAVANHLLQASKAAQLMGAAVVITGISSAMAQTLVGLGTALPDTMTMVDLQEGVEQIERALGVQA